MGKHRRYSHGEIMRVVTRRQSGWMLSMWGMLGVPALLMIEAKRTAVRGHRPQKDENSAPQWKRILKGEKGENEDTTEGKEKYDYYYPWDMYKYPPNLRPHGKEEGSLSKAPAAPPSTRTHTTSPHSIKKKNFLSKKGNRKKDGKGSKSKHSLKLSKSSSSGGEGKPNSGDHGTPDSQPESGNNGRPDSGDNGGGNNGGVCTSALAAAISNAVPEVVTRNPSSCCKNNDSQAVYITHALEEEGTPSGFEQFWDKYYREIALNSEQTGACFVMTGIDMSVSDRSMGDILLATNQFVRKLPEVVSMMSTDPTEDVELITEIRSIWDDPMAPSIGVFNTGYDNIIVDSILNATGRLPYIGYLEEASYGTMAAKISLNLLDGAPAKPLCFNARIGLVDFIGERCAAYYKEISSQVVEPESGVGCSANSTSAELYFTIVAQDVNTILSHVDCCSAVADAVERARNDDGRKIVVGCTDDDTSGGRVDFVTTQSIALQAYVASSWANFPIIQAQKGRDGRGDQYFPSLQSLVNTAIYNEVIL